MKGNSGDIEYTVEDGYLVLHTDMGDVMIGLEDMEGLIEVMQGIVDDE
ncbi:MAG: hypothetical protein GY766_17570 [Herbaspirillum sp.]|jgi:hypothetical protein|nr:hypothetical protein [Herbaspirillum sp.]MCP3656678.1 hypothetical protein [Herbaspirillum sp.]